MSIKGMALLVVLLVTADAFAGEAVTLKTSKDKINYSIGVSTIRNFKQYGTNGDIDLNMLFQGMQDELAGTQLLVSEQELSSVLLAVQTKIIQRRRTARALASMPGSTAPDETKKAKP